MGDMISVASGFQYSVNIAYDLNNNDKLQNFIPTKSSMALLEEIILSARESSNERARVLIGAYGKGKSHIVLTILSILMRKDLNLFGKMLPKLKENQKLYQEVLNYYESGKKILPVVISGSNTSLTQAFLLSLERTLKENELTDVMPETNYQAAINVIRKWKAEYPDTLKQFEKETGEKHKVFIDKLDDYNLPAYEQFERVYPKLTSGSVFNPFLGFDVVELYESVVKGLKEKGYSGIYVVYDEFSKFLEANISEASVSDTKMLQDFAEKCNRSGSEQLHLMLISHKEIANYIDTLPKQKVDGWRGVSERFRHIHLNNNFSQTYEVISSVIQKSKPQWRRFINKNKNLFGNLETIYGKHSMFSEMSSDEIENIIYACYPLHPASTFVLPRLSERVAQNERTLFTFLSSGGPSTLSEFLNNADDKGFNLLTPDVIYDYFEPLLKKEVYVGSIHDTYILTGLILKKLDEKSLDAKLIKTISLIYILEQFEKIKPTKDELIAIYSCKYDSDKITAAIDRLIDEEYVIYLKRSNGFLQLKQTSGVDIHQAISDRVASMKNKVTVKEILNSAIIDNYIYPSRYNGEKEMTRYFSFTFISADEVEENTNWDIKSENQLADGVAYAIIPENKTALNELQNMVLESSKPFDRFVFIIPKNYQDIEKIAREYNAVSTLKDQAAGDQVLFDEYEVIYDDLKEVINNYIQAYTRPEENKVQFIYAGELKEIGRRKDLSELLSGICFAVYPNTPIIINEAINRSELTMVAFNSRSKIIAGLVRNNLEADLGLQGTGQEVSIMRSTLLNPGVLVNEGALGRIDLHPKDDKAQLAEVFNVIKGFIDDARSETAPSFGRLYDRLLNSAYGIGLRKALIPIYIAAVFHEYKKEIIISDKRGEVPLSVDTLLQIEAKPDDYTLSYMAWDTEKETYIKELESIFWDNVIPEEKTQNIYDYVVLAMRRWYLSLPKYAKDHKRNVDGSRVNREALEFVKAVRQGKGSQETLFNKLPEIFSSDKNYEETIQGVIDVKKHYDQAITELKNVLIKDVRNEFSGGSAKTAESLTSVVKNWCEKLDQKVFEQLFVNGTEKCLELFKSITNDEDLFISQLSRLATDLRIDDWDDTTRKQFNKRIKEYRSTAEEFHSQESTEVASGTEAYQVSYVDDQGNLVTKRFEKVESSNRGKLLYNAITSNLDSMGQAISEQEKRQILMEILKKLC